MIGNRQAKRGDAFFSCFGMVDGKFGKNTIPVLLSSKPRLFSNPHTFKPFVESPTTQN